MNASDPNRAESNSRSTCPIGKALDLVGDRWSLLVFRDFFFKGFHEFREFRDSGEGIASNILSSRLKQMVQNGFIEAMPHPTDGKRKLYYLTDRGKSLLPLMIEMTLWGMDHTEGGFVPPEILDGMRNQRTAFSAQVLARLSAWEDAHLGQPES